jgi:hypothetical protein
MPNDPPKVLNPAELQGNEKKAAVAVARAMLRIAWTVMKNDQDYTGAGTDYYDKCNRRNHEHLVRYDQQVLTPGLLT